MLIEDLHARVMEAEPLPYDPRLCNAASPEYYEGYRTNWGHTYYLYLAALVRLFKPRKILEFGTDIGRSAAYMMTALPKDSSLITVEIGQHERVDLTPYDGDHRLHVIQGDDRNLEIYGRLDITGVDFLFMDSDHTYERVTAEWELYRHFLIPGAVVAMDDIHLNPGMERFWNGLAFPKVDAPRTVHDSGWGIFAPSGWVRDPA